MYRKEINSDRNLARKRKAICDEICQQINVIWGKSWTV